MRDVVIANNVVYDTGRDKVIDNGRPQVAPPRYQFALMARVRKESFDSLRVRGNVFHPRSHGTSNLDLPPQ